MRACTTAAKAHGWVLEEIPMASGAKLAAFKRLSSHSSATGSQRIYLSAGIHGDEPAGPLAALRLLQENRWPPGLELWFCPCLNPSGFQLNRRENSRGIDLNRDYLHLQSDEIRAHVAWLETQPSFDLCLCLHEDWESHGFYVYELNLDNRPSLAESIVAAAGEVCPIDLSEHIEGRPARNGVIRPDTDPRSRPQWPEAFYLVTHKTRLSYTLEAPSDFALSVRVNALVAGVNAALRIPQPPAPVV
ncbi:MAG: M14 family metallocarboxypeptidase [Verrucomicrobiae bacterium]|nr:M14 family metallocarboxypeptidase [Verrucomicrobiae bacterium]